MSAGAEGQALNERALADWLAGQVEGFSGPVTIKRFKGGQSNPTYHLHTPRKDYVIRRRPFGALLKGAHAIDREVRVLTALGAIGFPVPRVHGLCTDDTVIGASFYVMEHVTGRIFWDAAFPEVGRVERPEYFDAMNRTIAQLHQIDPHAAGLGDFGRPGNYCSRQIARWSKQYLEDITAGRDENLDRVIDSLPARVPEDDETRIVHGDFRCDNMIFDASEARVIAVLDWELSTLGSPLADFAYHAMMYRMPPSIVAGLLGVDLVANNIPSETEYVDAYCRRTGRASIRAYEFYIAFNFFRMAAIFHGIKGRVIRGSAASEHARECAKNFPVLARLAAEAMDACS